MIYLFTGNSSFLIKQQIKNWKEKFISKFGDFNLLHIKNIEEIDNNFLIENITSSSFLSEKKLIIIDLSEKISEEKQNFLIKILDKIADENILLFNMINPDKRTKFYKELKNKSELKEYNTQNEVDIYNIISQKYGNKINRNAIDLIIKYKANNIDKIISEIDKLLITNDSINQSTIKENIIPELEESIFQIIDDILNTNINQAINKIDIILNYTNIYAFYNNLIANLRTNIYIYKLKKLNKNSGEISKILNLGNRAFLINKGYNINYLTLNKLYIKLINIDKKMKTGKLSGTEEKDFRFELEKTLLV